MDPDPAIDPEPVIEMEREVSPETQKRQLEQQHRESNCRHREGIKWSQRTNPRISYVEDVEDVGDVEEGE